MIAAQRFVDILARNGLRQFTGVPCSFFQAAINCVIRDKRLRYTMVPNEGSALALAAGTYLSGTPTALLIQNSGFGNLINPLTSLHMIYHIPTLVFMSGRAYGIEDEPQHEIIGKSMGNVLDAIGIPHQDMPGNPKVFEKILKKTLQKISKQQKPFFFFVRKNTIAEFESFKERSPYPLKRIDAIRIIAEHLKPRDTVVVTTGKPSRELFTVADRPGNFYMQGSMGHAGSIGLGIALNKRARRTIILDGDGAALMHMGIFSSIGHYKPSNLHHILLDNESYETTGDQDTTSGSTNFVAIAKACGYRRAGEVVAEKALRSMLKKWLDAPGPSFLRIKINRRPTPGIGRISSRYRSDEITANFKKALGH